MFNCRQIVRPLLKTTLSSAVVLSLLGSVNYQNMAFQEHKDRYLQMSLEEKRKQYKCGNNFVTLSQIKPWPQYARDHNISTKFSTSDYVFNPKLNDKVSIFVGDITALEIDSVVNAANEPLRGGGGVDGAIHSAAGHDLLQAECRTLGGCPTGHSKMTGGYKLPAKYIIHTVGPVGEKPSKLQSCYQTSLELMREYQLKSTAFCCISTGVYGYPNENAAHVAISTVRDWLDTSPYAEQIERIIFCLFLPVDIEAYHKLMPNYFPLQ